MDKCGFCGFKGVFDISTHISLRERESDKEIEKVIVCKQCRQTKTVYQLIGAILYKFKTGGNNGRE